MAGQGSCEELLQNGLVPFYMALRTRKKERNGSCPYDRVHPVALPHAYQCSNQCEHIYSESGLGKHGEKRIYSIESRIEAISERDQNQLKRWKKDKQYDKSEKPLHENMAESKKVGELKKDGNY